MTFSSSISLILALSLIWGIYHSEKPSSPWIWGVMGSTLIWCVIDSIILYNFSSTPLYSSIFTTIYYLFVIMTSYALLGLFLDITGYITRTVAKIIVLSGVINAALYVSLPLALNQFQHINIVIASVGIMCPSACGILALLKCSIDNPQWLLRRKSFAVLIVLSSKLLIVFAALTFFESIGKTFLACMTINGIVMFLLYIDSENSLIRFLSLIPATREYRLVGNMQSLLFNSTPISFTEAREKFEYNIAKEAVDRCEGNKTLAAEMLGVSYATLLRKLKD